jgi:two-component system chemotaxis sensor kinase CheA
MMDLDPVEVFRQEAAELLESLEASLLDLGQNPGDGELVDAAFRALHTIKGSGAMFGFDRVASFTHDFETAFDLIRKGKIAAGSEIVTLSLEAKDHIRQLIEDPISTSEAPGQRIVASLQQLLAGGGAADAAHGLAAVEPAEAQPEEQQGWLIRIAFSPDVMRNGANPLALLDDLRELGRCTIAANTDAVPELSALEALDCLITWTVELAAACPRSDIEDVFLFVRDEMELAIEPLAAAETSVTLSEPSPKAETPRFSAPAPAEASIAVPPAEREPADRSDAVRRTEAKGQTVRVQAERLDELMDRVGELVIVQARLSQIAHAGADLSIKAIAEEIERLASGLRDSTMGVRMVPMGSLFGRFRRLIHDLSRDLGKPVEFVTIGEDTELDKTMIERLADPLVHLIRNSIDHGIEPPERRAASGKAATGRIELSARYVGAQVLVTVRDDGAGLDTARIRAKAEESGLLAPGAPMSDHDIHQFLFHPGFSTAKTVSALSGRGVGMDVVKRTIEAMRGTIDVSTVAGKGSSMTLRLPLTLAIIDGLLVRVGRSRCIIPISVIEECIELTPAVEARSRGRNMLDVRGDLVPFLKLRDLFGEPGEPEALQKIVIVTIGETRVGLVLDQIIGSHQTVIKTLSKLHADAAMFSGATIIGDGSVALILDVGQLLNVSHAPRGAERRMEAA